MRSAIGVLLLAYSSIVNASDWATFGETSLSIWYLDKESIASVDGKMKAWFLVDFKDEQTAYNGKKYKSTKQLSYFDCPSKTSALVQEAFFTDQFGEGTIADSYSLNKKNLEFTDVIPDSIGESMLKFVCQSVPKKKK